MLLSLMDCRSLPLFVLRYKVQEAKGETSGAIFISHDFFQQTH